MSEAVRPVDRPTARIIVIGPADRVLLFRWSDADRGRDIWFTPGGGLLPGESHEEAALRELREEVGISGIQLGPCVWTREHVLAVRGVPSRLVERFFVVRVNSLFVNTSGFDEFEEAAITGHRWMTVDEIVGMQEQVVPAALAELLPPILRGDYPVEPPDAGP